MRVIIRDRTTGLYFKDQGYWVAHGEDALDFQHSLSALNFCERNHLGDVEIVLRFANRSYDVRLPVRVASTPAD